MNLYIKCPKCCSPNVNTNIVGSDSYYCWDCGLKIIIDIKNKKAILVKEYKTK